MKQVFSFKTAILVSCFTLAITTMSFRKASSGNGTLGISNTMSTQVTAPVLADEPEGTAWLAKAAKWVGKATYDVTVGIVAAVVSHQLVGETLASHQTEATVNTDMLINKLSKIKMSRLG